ncbi:hypothetical protein [Alcanivorax quisquiliarum]|uniref:N-acetyltransferase domain-containing protein n=1 Tax=Alcanivorax quisquiliarum TaxID=2933565 RepID=A0ABT0E3J3_9GAMM|nr:hypothetical protein [Alcanivorax quisquiliarum]MCK0536379.1 hypothetical protein [Alcanivorax quisquiliarum]
MFPRSSTELHALDEISGLDLSALTIFTRYRGHPQLSHSDHQSLFRHELVSAVEIGGVCTTLSNEHGVIAACAIKPLGWDSQHFGLPMARLSLAASPACPPTALGGFLRDTFHVAKQKIPSLHVSCEVDIDDYPCLNALIDLGAEILDVKREYRWTSLKGIKPPKFLTRVRDYRPEDKPAVMQLLDKVHFESRFSRDPQLDQQKAADLYRLWLGKLLDAPESDRIALVMERDGRVQACGAIEKQDLGCAGVAIQLMNNGIYLSSPAATGSYYPIIYTLAERSLIHFSSVQTCVSLNNHAASRVLEKMGVGAESSRYALRLYH